MTIINRALHKAYKRHAESEPAPELKRPGSASVNGWVSKLREPIRPPVPPVSEPSVPETATAETPVAQEQSIAIEPAGQTSSAISPEPNRRAAGGEAILPAGATVRIDAGHSPTDSSAATPLKPATAAPAANNQSVLAEQWSWPPIVQRLLTCPAAPELRDLAVQLRALAAGNDLRCVAFSGPGRNVGRTSLVLTLASVLIADKSTRVAIVDADFNHPDAAQLISLHPAMGLEEAINNPGADDRVVTTLIAGRLAIVPLAKPVAAEAIDHRRIGTLQTFLRSLRREYDVVLIDAGPWEPAHPPLLLECRAVDAVVCVCRAGSSREESADERNFRQPGVEWLGVVETFVQAPVEKRGLAPSGAYQSPG